MMIVSYESKDARIGNILENYVREEVARVKKAKMDYKQSKTERFLQHVNKTFPELEKIIIKWESSENPEIDENSVKIDDSSVRKLAEAVGGFNDAIYGDDKDYTEFVKSFKFAKDESEFLNTMDAESFVCQAKYFSSNQRQRLAKGLTQLHEISNYKDIHTILEASMTAHNDGDSFLKDLEERIEIYKTGLQEGNTDIGLMLKKKEEEKALNKILDNQKSISKQIGIELYDSIGKRKNSIDVMNKMMNHIYGFPHYISKDSSSESGIETYKKSKKATVIKGSKEMSVPMLLPMAGYLASKGYDPTKLKLKLTKNKNILPPSQIIFKEGISKNKVSISSMHNGFGVDGLIQEEVDQILNEFKNPKSFVKYLINGMNVINQKSYTDIEGISESMNINLGNITYRTSTFSHIKIEEGYIDTLLVSSPRSLTGRIDNIFLKGGNLNQEDMGKINDVVQKMEEEKNLGIRNMTSVSMARTFINLNKAVKKTNLDFVSDEIKKNKSLAALMETYFDDQEAFGEKTTYLNTGLRDTLKEVISCLKEKDKHLELIKEKNEKKRDIGTLMEKISEF